MHVLFSMKDDHWWDIQSSSYNEIKICSRDCGKDWIDVCIIKNKSEQTVYLSQKSKKIICVY